MVNYNQRLQQIKKAQEELEKQRQQAQRVARQKITRKTTLGVAKRRRGQKEEVSKAKNIIQKIQKQKQELQKQERSIKEIQAKQKEVADYNAGRKAALRGGYLVKGVKSGAWEEGFRNAKKEKASYSNRQRELADLKERFGSVKIGMSIKNDFLKELRKIGKIGDYYSGKLDLNKLTAGEVKNLRNTGYLYQGKLKPIYTNGKLIGFEDPVSQQSFGASKDLLVKNLTNPTRQDKASEQERIKNILDLSRTPMGVKEILSLPKQQQEYLNKLKSDAKKGDIESQTQLRAIGIDYRTGKFFGEVRGLTNMEKIRLYEPKVWGDMLKGIKTSRASKYSKKKLNEINKQLKRKADQWSKEAKRANARLSNPQLGKDMERFRLLNRKAAEKKITAREKREFQRLKTKIGRGGKDFSDLIWKTAASSLINLGYGSATLAKELAKNPWATLSSLPQAVWDGIKADVATLKTGQPYDILQLGSEYMVASYALGGAGRVTKSSLRGMSKFLPKYVAFKNNQYIIRKAPQQTFKVRGKERYLKQRVQKPSFKRPFQSASDFLKGRKPGQFRKFTKDPGLVLKQSTVKSGQMPFSQQIKQYSGKEVTAINAAADQITSLIKRKRLIRKPIPGEENFPLKIKRVLNKLDNGQKLTIKEIIETSMWLKNNVAPNITLLERSIYADPASGLRISRLGITKEKTATLRDLFTGNFKLRGSKPQVTIFEKAKVANAPKRIRQIANKIDKKGISAVSERELAEILKWQLKRSTKFKAGGSPIYAGGVELEITAYGSYVKRLKQVGFRYINGKKVTFVTAELWKPSKAIAKQIKLANVGKLTKAALKKLEKLLSKKLGRKIRVETPSLRKTLARATRRSNPNIPVLRIRARGIQAMALRSYLRRSLRKPPKIKRTTIRGPRLTSKRTKPRTTRSTRSKSTITPKLRGIPRTKRMGRPITPPRDPPPRIPRPGRSPPTTPTTKKTKPIPRIGGFKRKTLSKAQPAYYVVMKRKGKLARLSPKPFTREEAKDYLAYRIDTGLSRQAFFIPTKKTKKVVGVPKPIKGYYNKVKKKLRPYKIRYGQKKQLVNGYIERKKYIGDTKSEIRSLQYEKRKAPKRRTSNKKIIVKRLARKRRVKRKITPTQRKELLNRLKKARVVKMRKLKRK